MSTKSTIKHSKDFHFYEKCFDEEAVYLQMNTDYIKEFSINEKEITVRIPKEIWLMISNSYNCDFKFHKMSDEKIKEMVEFSVNKRIEDYNSANESDKNMIKLTAFMIYGDIEDEKETQIKNGISYYLNKKEYELKVINYIENNK